MTEVAATAGISPETLRKIETGRVPTPAFFTIAALATALGISSTSSPRSPQRRTRPDDSADPHRRRRGAQSVPTAGGGLAGPHVHGRGAGVPAVAQPDHGPRLLALARRPVPSWCGRPRGNTTPTRASGPFSGCPNSRWSRWRRAGERRTRLQLEDPRRGRTRGPAAVRAVRRRPHSNRSSVAGVPPERRPIPPAPHRRQPRHPRRATFVRPEPGSASLAVADRPAAPL